MSFQDMEETNILYDSDETDIDKILQILTDQYVQEKEKLNNLRLQLQLSLQSPELTENIKRVAILKAEEQKLDQEIEQQMLDQHKAKIKSRIFRDLWVRKHISDTVDQCRNFLPKLRQEIQDTKDHITREKETLKETNIIHEVLSERIERQSDEHLSRESENCILKKELNDVKRSYNTLKKELVKFVDTHFPPHKLVRKDMEEDYDDDYEDNINSSLKVLLEDLMNQSFNNPSEPYLYIDTNKVWPPYVETLICAGIARKHPLNTNKIALVEYHL
ncbi:10542_t:CDS:2 [Gigaspora margarita]|uniref:10542_t:CDS:1 n=1 Tax=Gigaspora margarita TaxID=4874 RepID=A0ABN7VUZ0_GIGMA|nr:10542_t:CDS:2 [Gigaspora margarita]